MKRHIFLTGEIQTGKSTVIQRFIERSGIGADGFVTKFLSRGFERELFLYRFDTQRGESGGMLAAKLRGTELTVLEETFNDHGARIVRESGSEGLIIMDELGVFEERAPLFKAAVFEKLDGSVPVLGVVKKRKSPFLDAVRNHPHVRVTVVTKENRDAIARWLSEKLGKK